MEELEEGVLRRIAGQCNIPLKCKPYHTGTRYLQSLFEPRPVSTASPSAPFSATTPQMQPNFTAPPLGLKPSESVFAERDVQYTAETLFLKSKKTLEYTRHMHLKGSNSKLLEVFGHYEHSNNYLAFKRKYQAIIGSQSYAASGASLPYRSKLIPPLTLWSDSYPGSKSRAEDEVFTDICIRSHPLSWSTVAQEFTTVDEPTATSMSFELDVYHSCTIILVYRLTDSFICRYLEARYRFKDYLSKHLFLRALFPPDKVLQRTDSRYDAPSVRTALVILSEE